MVGSTGWQQRRKGKDKERKEKEGQRRKGNKKFTLVGGGAVRFGRFSWLAALTDSLEESGVLLCPCKFILR